MRTIVIEDRDKINEIITSCRTCFLGMASKTGEPYVLPMNFGLEDDEIILHSAPAGRMIDLLRENPKVCITFCLGEDLAWQNEKVACSYRMKSKSVIAEGKVKFIEEMDKKEECLRILLKNYSNREFKFNAPAVRNVAILKMKIEKLCAKEFGAKASTVWNP